MMKAILITVAVALGCGGQEERQNVEPEPMETAEAREAEAREVPPEATEAPPEATDVPPRPEEGATAAAGAVPGSALTVQVEEVTQQEAGGPGSAELEVETEVLGSGVVRVELDDYSAPCGPQIPFLAHLDGSVIRLFRAETGPVTRCVQTFDVTLTVGPLTTGEYTLELGRPGPDARPQSLGAVTIEREGPDIEEPGDSLALSQTFVRAQGGGTEVGTPEPLPAEGQQLLRVTVKAGVPCTGDTTEVLFAAFRDGDRLILRPHAPDVVARCPGPVRDHTLLLETGEWMPTTIEVQNRMGTKQLDTPVTHP